MTVTIKKKSQRTTSQPGLPSYKKPPVNEVAIGFTFENLDTLKIPHIGLLWERFRNDYPLIDHAVPLATNQVIPIDSATGLPLPRVWFIDKAENRLIQVQSNQFYFNWRHRKDQDVYPRYENIVREFKSHLTVLQGFLNDTGLGTLRPSECELTYINQIPKGEGWEIVDDWHNVVTDFCWRKDARRFLPVPANLTWQAGFALPDEKGRMRIRLAEAKRKADDMPLLVLELSTRGLGKDKSIAAIWDWYPVAHEWIVRGFTDITSPEMHHKYWEREDVTTN